MSTNQGVSPTEKTFILTHAFAECRKKALKKNFGNDKVTSDEKSQFQNCVVKYLTVSDFSYEGLREGFLTDLKE